MPLENPQYIGDAVYASVDHGGLVLTTEHHDPNHAGNVIFLEPEGLRKLEEYIKTQRELKKIS